MNKDVLAYTRTTYPQVPKEDGSRDFVDNEKTEEFFKLYQAAIDAPTFEEYNEYCVLLNTCWPKGWDYLYKQWFNHHRRLCAAHVLNEKMTWGI